MINKSDLLAKMPNLSGENITPKLLQKSVQEVIWLSSTAVYKYWLQMECQGLEHLPQDRGYIIAANHSSHLDGPAVITAQGQHISQVYSLAAKDYFFNNPTKAWLCENFLNMIPFKRKGKFLDCIPTCQQVIAQKKAILLFPEGTRSVTGKLQTLKPGLGILVMKLRAPVVPAYIQGTYQALPKGKYFPTRYPIRVSFGPPREFNHYWMQQNVIDNHQVYREIVNDVYVGIEELMDGSTR
ncbi:MAG: 1-acyl-sn-glycerol-3-phosphate acyltransferase [Symploca sp. SIO1B1]|nr:1-acyl-sn-glycerol-3-phosphate acyltransferase [Symploca sp. SIO2D2]NER46424.1 1-acyl-sn-glycerol-3-phosphate acyltransferase [Symploca sp. SIO1A3]NER94376.1 1-acyl-sn-glycerol-3-phosphate acyltransferase [Symploca sp. SIO1B1]